jgi:drug/metabolite transporter (DMT)-like permease
MTTNGGAPNVDMPSSTPGQIKYVLETTGYVFLFSLAFGIPFMLIVGLVSHMVLVKFQKHSVLFYALAGGAMGFAIALSLSYPLNNIGALVFVLLSSFSGTLSALFFVWIRRPKKYLCHEEQLTAAANSNNSNA